MSILLFEEVHEVRSIYDIIKKYTTNMRKYTKLKKLIIAIENEVEKGINDIEWIKELLQENREKNDRFYTELSRIIYTVKYRAIVLSQLINIITTYTYLFNNDIYREPLTALEKLINNAKQYLKDISNINLYVLVEYGYLEINILEKHNVIILCIPSYDLFKPWKWSLLFHELGHLLFNKRRDEYIIKFREEIQPLIKQQKPRGYKEKTSRLLSVWEQHWLTEFISDLYGVALGGPAYTYAFIIEVFNSESSIPTTTHPSLDSRIYLQLEYLQSIREIRKLTERIYTLWSLYRGGDLAEKLGYPFSADILNKLKEIFTEITGKPVFLNYIDKIIELREKIDKDENIVGEPLHLVLALSLSDKRREDPVQKKIIKAIAEDQ